MPIVASGLLLSLCAVRCIDTPAWLNGEDMTAFGTFSAGLQIISTWLMSMLAVLAVLVSIIICMLFVEIIFERSAIAQAYTVKTHSSDNECSSKGDRSAM